ncbi:MAG: hypothetical protein WC284_11750 [Candidimonas sp.]
MAYHRYAVIDEQHRSEIVENDYLTCHKIIDIIGVRKNDGYDVLSTVDLSDQPSAFLVYIKYSSGSSCEMTHGYNEYVGLYESSEHADKVLNILSDYLSQQTKHDVNDVLKIPNEDGTVYDFSAGILFGMFNHGHIAICDKVAVLDSNYIDED